MDVAHLSAVVLFVTGLAIRNVYELLKQRSRIDPTNARIFVAVFTSMCVMWLSWFAVGMLAPVHLTIPPIARWVGLGVVSSGLAFAVGGMWQLKGVENIDHLVTTGLFSRIRHPMYIGFAFWIIGWCAFTGAVTSLVLAPFGMASVLWWRQLEESDLAARYGSQYAQYKAATWL